MSTQRVLILGGYGNFGQFITKILLQQTNAQLIIAGRNLVKAQALKNKLNSDKKLLAIQCDTYSNLDEVLAQYQPEVVIQTCGPFQNQDYHVAQCCIAHKAHYIDLSDARDFVANIGDLSDSAKKHNLFVCSGASSVPGLSSALISHYYTQFSTLNSIDYAIATAQLTNQGLATRAGVLSYAGKPIKTKSNGIETSVYVWQSLRTKHFWQLGKRFLGNCDVPDLTLFPKYYPTLKNIRFQAGLELRGLHLILFLLANLVRCKLLPPLHYFARHMMKVSRLFNWLGTNNTGFFMVLEGLDAKQKVKKVRFEIIAQEGHGLYIPCIPANALCQNYLQERLCRQVPCHVLTSLRLTSI